MESNSYSSLSLFCFWSADSVKKGSNHLCLTEFFVMTFNRIFKLLVQGYSHYGGASGQVGILPQKPSQPGQTLRQKCGQLHIY